MCTQKRCKKEITYHNELEVMRRLLRNELRKLDLPRHLEVSHEDMKPETCRNALFADY